MTITATSAATGVQPTNFLDDPFAALNTAVGLSAPANQANQAPQGVTAVEAASTVAQPLQSGNAVNAQSPTDLNAFLTRVAPQIARSIHVNALHQGMAEALANPVQTGQIAASQGSEAMRQWVRFQLGVVKDAPLPFELQLFKDGGFARGVAARWNGLLDKVMNQMSPEMRKAYEPILNEEMGTSMQLALLHDKTIEEYTPVLTRKFIAVAPVREQGRWVNDYNSGRGSYEPPAWARGPGMGLYETHMVKKPAERVFVGDGRSGGWQELPERLVEEKIPLVNADGSQVTHWERGTGDRQWGAGPVGHFVPLDHKQHVMSASTLAAHKALMEQDAKLGEQVAQINKDQESGKLDALTAANKRLDLAGQYIVDNDLTGAAVKFRVDSNSIGLYQGAKFEAATEFAKSYAPIARDGIVALGVGRPYARQWLAGELGFKPGQPFDNGLKEQPKDRKPGIGANRDAPGVNTRAMLGRWDHLGGSTLMAMPEFLREKYAPLANDTMEKALHATLHMDYQIGEYGEPVVHRYLPRGFEEDEYKYFLKQDGNLGNYNLTNVKNAECIDKWVLPILNVGLYFIPVAGQILGPAMTVANSVRTGLQSGNWLGAGLGMAAGLAGLGVAGSALAAGTSATGAATSVASTATSSLGQGLSALAGKAANVLGYGNFGIGGATTAVSTASSTAGTIGTIGSVATKAAHAARIAQGAYGLKQGIDHGSLIHALGSATAILGGLSPLGKNPLANLSNVNPSLLPDWLTIGARAASDGINVYQGIKYDAPAFIASGATGLVNGATTALRLMRMNDYSSAREAFDKSPNDANLRAALDRAGNNLKNAQISDLATGVMDIASNMAQSAQFGDQAGLSLLTSRAMGLWYGLQAGRYPSGSEQAIELEKRRDMFNQATMAIYNTIMFTRNPAVFEIGKSIAPGLSQPWGRF